MNGLPLNEIIHGDCLEVMRQFPDKSIDMILCDLPYGVTKCKWDTIIPFEPLWEQYERIIKDNRAIVLFATQPFTTDLINSNRKLYRYLWYWKKERGTGISIAKFQPMRIIEDILVFGRGSVQYYPIMRKVKPHHHVLPLPRDRKDSAQHMVSKSVDDKGRRIYRRYEERYPVNLLEFPRDNTSEGKSLHPTQKPVELFEYLIKTYTLPGEVVLDNCIGSGTTAIACINTGRNFIGIEIEEKYVKMARGRIENHKKLDKMRLFPISELETGKLQYKGLFEPEDESYGEG